MMTQEQKEKARELRRIRREKDPEAARRYQREWYAANSEKIAEYKRTKRERHPDAQKVYSKRWRDKNPGKQSKCSASWARRNRDKVNKRDKERLDSDPKYKLSRRLRNRLYHAVTNRGASKCDKSNSLIGCSIQFLMGYLESQFSGDMKWSNYGELWEIDHRIPCSSYDLTDESHQRSCFHYTNLQPMLVPDNRKKGSKIPETIQPEIPCPSNSSIGS